jgi:hypothetical protein
VITSALFVVPGSSPEASKRWLFWSYSRSPGRFPSGRSHYPGRHVQVQAEHAKCLTDNVPTGVLVSISNIATVRIRTDEDAIRKGEIFFARSTAMTQLTRREKPIHFQEHSPLARDFAFQKIEQLAYRRIRERAGKAAIADEPFDMHIFYRNNAAGLRYLRGQLMEPIQPNAGNLSVQSPELLFRLLPVFPTLGASCQFFVQPAQLFQLMGQRSWFSYHLPSESVASRFKPTSIPTGSFWL